MAVAHVPAAAAAGGLPPHHFGAAGAGGAAGPPLGLLGMGLPGAGGPGPAAAAGVNSNESFNEVQVGQFPLYFDGQIPPAWLAPLSTMLLKYDE